MNISIVSSKDADLIAVLNETVQRLHQERYPAYFKAYDYEVVRKSFKEMLEKDNWFAYVAYDADQPIGYIVFYIRNYGENPFRYSYKGISVDQLSVIKEYQNRGIGSQLMKKAEAMGREIGASQIELTFWDKNTEAKKFYNKKGFEEGIHFVVKRF
ncbi:MAG: GNAT family N-acetyltransferase [Lentisphaeria bacterium]